MPHGLAWQTWQIAAMILPSRMPSFALLALSTLTLCLLLAFPPFIPDAHADGSIKIEDAWARVTIPSRPAAGYMVIRNQGDQLDRFVSGTSALVERVEIHTHLMEEGVMRMRRVENVDVPGGADVKFAPGGFHLMMFGLNRALKKGEVLPVTLIFENAGEIEVEFRVGRP